jgi:hypothetical protein
MLPYDPVFEDRSLPHQIVLRIDSAHSQQLTVACTCTLPHLIAAKPCWVPGEALALYREFHGRNSPPGPLPDGEPSRF